MVMARLREAADRAAGGALPDNEVQWDDDSDIGHSDTEEGTAGGAAGGRAAGREAGNV